MTIEEAIKALTQAELHVTYETFGNGESDFRVQGDFGPWRDKTIYRWDCELQDEDSFWVVWPPPHPWNDPGPAFAVPSLRDAVSLTVFMYQRRIKEDLMGSSELREYADWLLAETEHTQRIYEEWKVLQTL